MGDNAQFDFWYAVHNTHILLAPTTRLETFGSTMLNYHLVTEMMDAAEKIRVREGRVKAQRPEIITPQSFMETIQDGFGEEARAYAEWLRANEKELMILRYGFSITKEHISEEIVTGPLEGIANKVKKVVAESNDPLAAVVVGVEKPWEVCLLKLMVEVAQKSAGPNVQDFRSRGIHTPQDAARAEERVELEAAFCAAATDAEQVQRLYEKLQKYGVFEEYQDRFFTLARRHNFRV
jgi:hypothetical protein